MGTSVVIADDHPVVRRGVRALLASREGYEVIGEAGNGREAVDVALRLLPAIVLMDPAMPGLNGADATSQIRKDCPDTIVLALSMHSDGQYVSRMLAAGAAGYLLKTCEADELLHAIDITLKGQTYLTPEVASEIVDHYVNGNSPNDADASCLSDREREVLQLLAEGKSGKETGQILHISSRTVDSHRQRIMAKLRVDSVAGLTKCAIRMGLTTAEN
jgi:DNA-binding NarL/FixJ family response regulator